MFRPLRLLFPVLIFVGAAHATTLLKLDLDELSVKSAAVVRGTVKSSVARWTKNRSRIVTEITVTVKETWKGEPATEIVILQQGGVVGDLGQRVHGTVAFREGEEIVLFLEAHGPRFMLTGMSQGAFRVEDNVATQALDGDMHLLDAARQSVLVNALRYDVTDLAVRVRAALSKDARPATVPATQEQSPVRPGLRTKP